MAPPPWYHAEQGRYERAVCPVQHRAAPRPPLQDGELMAEDQVSAVFHASSR
jgi:hypothetical protein